MHRPARTASDQLAHDRRPPPGATRVRYGVLGFACGLSMIVYLDRACMATAVPSIVQALHLGSEADLKWVFSAFALAYALFEVPTGWWGDVFGPRRVLIRIVLWWSLFTLITGMVGISVGGYVLGGVTMLAAVRFVFGMGEAGAYPNITRALHNWFPRQERGMAQGAVWMAGRLMGGLTPLVWMLLVPAMHWRAVFGLFGLIGVAWAIAFAFWFRNRPEEKPTVNAAELAWIRAGSTESAAAHARTPWPRFFANRNLQLLCLMYACQAYEWYFHITYLPRFLEQQYHVPSSDIWGALYKGGPLWLGAVGCLLGGLLTDRFVRRTGNLRLGRRLFGVIGHSATGLCFLACLAAPSAFWFFAAISLAGFFTDLAMGAGWAVCQDIGRRHAAVVAGFMNMVGNLGGALAGWMFGFVLDQSLAAHAARLALDVKSLSATDKIAGLMPGYQINFLISAAVCVVGVLCWLRIDPTQPVIPEEEERP